MTVANWGSMTADSRVDGATMLGFLQPKVHDPILGKLTRRGSWWTGALELPRLGEIELRVSGDRYGPAPRSIHLAARLPQLVGEREEDIARELYERYLAALDTYQSGFAEVFFAYPEISTSSDVWLHVSGERVDVDDSRGDAIEVACAVAWDEDRTIGLRFLDERVSSIASISTEYEILQRDRRGGVGAANS